MIRPGESDLLLVTDIQRDFCTGGALAVPGGEAVVAPINRLMGCFDHVVATQDWHPQNHASFASNHPGREPFDTIEMPYGPQVLWPDHCVQGTAGAELHPSLDLPPIELIIRKGFHPNIDSYSAFLENDRRTPTGLAGYAHERGLRRLFLAGLALDYCIRFSAEDAQRFGFEAVVVEDACRAIDQGGSLDAALAAFAAAGIARIRADEIAA